MTDPLKKNIYPAFILLLLTGFLIFLVWSAFQAAGLGSRVTDVDYYSKGLKYNATQVERRAAEILGWHLETLLTSRTIDFHLTDRKGDGVARAIGSLSLAIPGRAENIRLPLHEVSAGLYRVTLADNLAGTILARLEMECDGARLNRQLLLNF